MQEFLAEAQIASKVEVNAKKEKMDRGAVAGLLKSINHLYVAKGQKFLVVSLPDKSLDGEALLSLVMGPTGNLRAPTLRIGKKLYVGFHREMLENLGE